MTAQEDPALAEAIRKVNAHTDAETAYRQETRRMADEMTWNSWRHQFRREGKAEGLVEGLAEGEALRETLCEAFGEAAGAGVAAAIGRVLRQAIGQATGEAEVIRALLARGLDPDDVANLTGIPVARVEGIASGRWTPPPKRDGHGMTNVGKHDTGKDGQPAAG